MLNVRFILAPPNLENAALPGTETLNASDLTVLENPTAWPRAFFTDTVGAFNSSQEFRQFLEQGDGRPFAALPGPIQARLPLPPRDFAKRVVTPARNYRLTNNTTTFEIDAPSEGVAVLSEANVTDDILAYVDDEPTLCLPVNHAFRGVLIRKPGHHVVRFEYWPAVLDHALNLALCGLIAFAFTFWWWWRAGRKTAKTGATEPEPPKQEALAGLNS
jgi:hypothetical protein